MSKPLSIGDRVLCRLFNTPERKFYGARYIAVILEKAEGDTGEKRYRVRQLDSLWDTWLKRKEILRRVK